MTTFVTRLVPSREYLRNDNTSATFWFTFKHRPWHPVACFGIWTVSSYPAEWCVCGCSWWRHQVEAFSSLLAICAGNSPTTGEFPSQRPVTWSFDVFFDLRLNKWLSKQLWGWWFATPLHLLWRHCNVWRPNLHVQTISWCETAVSGLCLSVNRLNQYWGYGIYNY